MVERRASEATEPWLQGLTGGTEPGEPRPGRLRQPGLGVQTLRWKRAPAGRQGWQLLGLRGVWMTKLVGWEGSRA